MTKSKITYTNCTPEQIAFWEEVTSWEIVPLKYATPQGFEINMNRQELGFFDSGLLSDTDLSSIEFRLMVDICAYYPTEFDYVVPSEADSKRPEELQDLVKAANILKSLAAKGYISLNGFK